MQLDRGPQDCYLDEAEMEMRAILITRASRQGAISYSELVRSMKTVRLEPHSPILAGMLGRISEYEDSRGRGLLSVIVVHKDGDMQPGNGFFALAQELGRDISDRMVCWVQELNKVYGHWAK